jgi:hypothetical protein
VLWCGLWTSEAFGVGCGFKHYWVGYGWCIGRSKGVAIFSMHPSNFCCHHWGTWSNILVSNLLFCKHCLGHSWNLSHEAIDTQHFFHHFVHSFAKLRWWMQCNAILFSMFMDLYSLFVLTMYLKIHWKSSLNVPHFSLLACPFHVCGEQPTFIIEATIVFHLVIFVWNWFQRFTWSSHGCISLLEWAQWFFHVPNLVDK